MIFDQGEKSMKDPYFTQKTMDQVRNFVISLTGAVILVGMGVIFLLTAFDVLVK
jgi:hypothetical protein